MPVDHGSRFFCFKDPDGTFLEWFKVSGTSVWRSLCKATLTQGAHRLGCLLYCRRQIIGAGVIALTGIAIGMTGPAVMFAYLAAAAGVIVTLLIMMAGTVLPATGAYYVWTSRLSGGWLGSIVLLLILLASVVELVRQLFWSVLKSVVSSVVSKQLGRCGDRVAVSG